MRTGQIIATLRQQAGLSQEELAERLYISRELVSKWENDKRRPDPGTVRKLAAFFGVAPEEFTDPLESAAKELSACFPDKNERSAEDLTALLNAFLASLSRTDRMIFLARYYHGYSSSETAALLGLKEGYIRKRLTLIRRKLSEYKGGTL